MAEREAVEHRAPGRRSLDDRYAETGGRALLSGVQAVVRLVLEQRWLDTRRHLRTAAFVSGYEGSPLAGLDLELGRIRTLLDDAGVVFAPAVNEELAATAVGGTQLVGDLPRHAVDGVAGFWYGKNPGLDRAADAIRHANHSGTAALGGAVAVIGDDPMAKSSTLPSSSLAMARSLSLPVLAPGSVADVVRLGLHAVALSRHSGMWAALAVVADVADGAAVADFGAARPDVPVPDPARPAHRPLMVGPGALRAEEELVGIRLPLALDYARRAGLNSVVVDPAGATIGIVASGHTFAVVRRALDDMGIDADACGRLGLRLIRLDLPWPLDGPGVRALTRGLDEVLVVEDKASFIESQVKEALYGQPRPPTVVGKTDHEGRPLVPASGSVDGDTVTRVLGRRLDRARLPPRAADRLAAVVGRPRLVLHASPGPGRTAAFCSGCPHNISTRAADDQLVGLGIGCHVMAALDPAGRGHQLGMTQMGGEGAQWSGMAPFAGGEHYVQNLGDGTFFHSGSLAVRAAVAAGVDITYKLLYNDAVAMTGGQHAEGRIPVPELTRLLALEGVRRVVVTTPEPRRYRGVRLDPIAEVRHRDDMAGAMEELAAIGGVTVLIHDDQCAAEQRRLRRRGSLPEAPSRVWINERVCEGCGDCGEKSTCLSVVPVETAFGRKTNIRQGSCNSDLSCLRGDCPSFVMVTPASGARRHPPRTRPPLPVALRDPGARRVPDDLLVRMPGIGGTGVVTVARIVQMAAHLDGRYAAGLDQTGLAQKGGPVVSDVRISTRPIDAAVKAGARTVDLLLGLDLLGASAAENLATADPARTVAVVNTAGVATMAMVRDPALALTGDLTSLRRATRASEDLFLDAGWMAERLFADQLPTNVVMLGAAFQHGCLPVSAGAMEEAIALNGVDAERNLDAFAWGRAVVLDRGAVEAALAPAAPPVPVPPASILRRTEGTPAPLRQLVERRAADLVAYQGAAYARRYVEDVLDCARIEATRTADPDLPVSCAYARGLHKVMAYKDEYEVARLHLDPVQRDALAAEFGEGMRSSALLQPPFLKALGLRRKISLGPAQGPALRVLRAGRHLRGTRLDPFGHADMRRTERELPARYRSMVGAAVARMTAESAPTVVELAAAVEDVRGYEDVKRRSLERFERRCDDLLARLARLDAPAAEPPAGAHRWPQTG